MNCKKRFTLSALALPLWALSAPTIADYKTDIGYTALQNELGVTLPDGSGVKVTQVEASSPNTDPNILYFAPDPSADSMTGKMFSYPGLSCASPPCTPSVFSGHALGVADRFYGNSLSIATGVNDIHSYEVNQWIGTLYSTNTGKATSTDRRIANHSWAGNGDTTAQTSEILRLVDRQVNLNEYIQIAASGSGSPLLGNAYNVIAIGLTNGSASSSIAVDDTYVDNRATTDLVAPAANLSTATPIVSATAALLVQTGHQQTNLSLGSNNISGVGTVYNGERSETVKAILMAGAERQTENTSGYGDITDYRSTGHETNNGLDNRYGAGQVNIDNSYQIIEGGEQNSLEDGGDNLGQIDQSGFDYDDAFGGAISGTVRNPLQSNSTATYAFTASADETLSAALVWNLGVTNNSAMDTTLHHLGLALVDVTENNSIVASSNSMFDNTQNIYWEGLVSGHDYQLQVSSLEGAITQDYALAWNRTINATPVPLPAAFWLFGSVLAGLVGFQRKPSFA